MALFGLLLILAAALAIALVAYLPRPGARAAGVNWPTLLGSNARNGYNSAETAINASTASHLNLQWTRNVAGRISTQPVVANGLLYWGSWDGMEHASNMTTGSDAWSVNLGQTYGSCDKVTYGVLSSSTIATITINGTPIPVDFVGGGLADLYALNANTGATIWHTSLASSPAHFEYGSTAYYNGSVYIGVSSLGDCPLSTGSLVQVNAVTGQMQHTFSTVPSGCIGASVWGSPAIDEANGKIYFVTGNGGKCRTGVSYSESIIELNASDLSLVAFWQVPAAQAPGDSDFGSTPTLFQATINGSPRSLVGVPNKNGIYYAFDRTNIGAGPIWEATLAVAGDSPENGKGSIAASAFDGSQVYVAGGNTTISGKSCAGSVQALNPATGAPVWQTCLGAPVLAPVMAVSGLVAIGSGQDVVVVNSANGNILYSYNDNVSGSDFWSGATISNGMLIQGTTGGTLYAFAAPSTATPTPTPSGTPANLQPGPVNKTWYFAEGRVGGGFNEYLSMNNPNNTNCAVNITYLYTPDRGVPLTRVVTINIPPNTRYEEGVPGDLGTSPSGYGITDSAIVTVDNTATPNCAGIVAERPMYFNALGTNSGSDVPGVTHLSTSFYIGYLATNAQPGGGAVSSFITILNPPNGQTATVTATYYAGGQVVGTDTATVPGGTRGTIFPDHHSPALPAYVSVVVTSNQPVAVERPEYFSGINGGNAGIVSGGADVIAVQSLSTDWLFAEGYTGGQFQENFVIANLDPNATTAATVTIKLEPQNGAAPTSYTVSVPRFSQVIWNVNAVAPGQSLSAEITSSGPQIVVEREMYFHYLHIANGRTLSTVGGSDALGQSGPAAKSNYSFAEGYVNAGYDEWLTLQNPTPNPEVIWLTLYNAMGTTYTTSVLVPGQSRATEDITGMVIHNLYHNGDGFKGYEVSMTVQTTSGQGGPFVAERPMYITVGSIQAGTDIIGYTGG